MQILLMLAGILQATVLFGFYGSLLVILICAIALLYQFLGPTVLALLF